ncbi:1-acyl-sn-glycerol-3-phosphate acyltransferase [Ammonifex degensii KC4]|uniref:1-acyl-sn-glycerol-3-phosphate acyltransferase n=1 Tax=Ammonifex degensii (strain DSM 10501 / KC4) TaxID=429009 RepID=C9RDD8_AMMDK|nr:lysophospholipid acyltransferase family protein [Ammonifex degensii]ACX52265.1 1-acyl-sn-glycerol-3-phosphate acyltransferase [Ammonifex degensii KC4]
MFYWFAWLVCRLYLHIFRSFRVEGLEHFPREGPVIVAANHQSYLDPVALGCALPRRVYYMAKEELFHIPVLRTLIRWLGAFPVKREEMDRRALRTALNLLARGQVVGIFPEGTRSREGKLLPLQPGAALLALKSGAPVVPVALTGTRGWWGRVRVKIGRPFYLTADGPSRSQLTEGSRKIEVALKELLGVGS